MDDDAMEFLSECFETSRDEPKQQHHKQQKKQQFCKREDDVHDERAARSILTALASLPLYILSLHQIASYILSSHLPTFFEDMVEKKEMRGNFRRVRVE